MTRTELEKQVARLTLECARLRDDLSLIVAACLGARYKSRICERLLAERDRSAAPQTPA